AVGIGAVFL
nr:Chain C, HIV-1 Clade A BG505 Fusion Peptide (residue 512-520) [Human immunodeficiency virus 1]6NCP_E Chain E, HIV-1 Fusion Peptide (residues 512-520) [synthetic construct]